MTKKQRLNEILSLIEKNEIDTQEELTSYLNSLGYNVSQATVSRDINELNLIKTSGIEKKYKYAKPNVRGDEIPDKIISLYKHVVVSVSYANNLIVVKTLGGNAGSAGMAIDAMHFPEILGTIAGDDTLLVVTKTNADAETIVKSLKVL